MLSKYFDPQGGIAVAACHSRKVPVAQELVGRNGHGWCNLTNYRDILQVEEYKNALETLVRPSHTVYIISDDNTEMEETQKQAANEMRKRNIPYKIMTLGQYRDIHCADSHHDLDLGHGHNKPFWERIFGRLELFQYTCVASVIDSPTVSREIPEEFFPKLESTRLHFIFEMWQEGTLNQLVAPEIPPGLKPAEVELLAQAMPFMQIRRLELPPRIQVESILPKVFRQRNLTELILSNVSLGKDGARLLVNGPKGLRDPPLGLQTLILNGANLGEEGAKELRPALGIFVSLQELNLKGNLLGKEGMRALSEEIGKLRALTKLDVSANNIGKDGADSLEISLKNLGNLREIFLNDNQLPTENVLKLWNALHVGQREAEPTRLTHFSFADDSMTQRAKKELVQEIEKQRRTRGDGPLVAE